MEGYIILFIIIDGVLAILPANVAKRKGKDFAAWYIYGFFLWIIAMLHAISLPEQNVYNSNINSNDTTNNLEFKVLSHGNLENNIDLNSPVEVLEWDILSKNDGNIYFNILFRNLHQGIISAIKLELQGLNSFNEVVKVEGKDTFTCYIQDLDGQLGCKFNNRNSALLPEKDIRKLNISIKEIAFNNGNFIYKNKKNEIEREIECITENEELMILKKHTKTGVCYAKKENNLWICVCGRPNYENVKKCVRCNLDKEYVFTELSREKILEEIEEQKKVEAEEEKNKILKEQEFVEKQKKVRKRKVIYMSSFIVVLVIVALCSRFYNKLETTPLTKFVKDGNMKKTDMSIKLGNDINEVDDNGDTPLNIAIKEGETEVVKKLIEHGVDLNKKDENGETPFDVANRLKKKEIEDLILEHGGNGFKKTKVELNIDSSIIRAGLFSTVNGEVNKISAISKVYYNKGKETDKVEYFFSIKEKNYMYKGKIENGFFDGFGALYLQGYGYGREDFGKLYDGEFKKGKFNGYGCFYWCLESSEGVETVYIAADLKDGNITGDYSRYYSDGSKNDKGTCYNGIVTSNVYGVTDENSK
ncbi:ankyrin repeat domain-containing protein [Clostridium senegalense]|uniref:Uncharacterized protein n=1 Tax=Clostridium senegalense TaxID=1465809 RepID=A0A6M0H2S5_9CLOT|nr:ankyrin repeat domain-containing protein [Clostridium senegalense]NEU05025.1 hypothetical protein [Clostridium senegalense]